MDRAHSLPTKLNTSNCECRRFIPEAKENRQWKNIKKNIGKTNARFKLVLDREKCALARLEHNAQPIFDFNFFSPFSARNLLFMDAINCLTFS